MADGKTWKSTAFWLGVVFVLALVVRIAFNIGVGFDEDSERYLYSGNDPWYHHRTVETMLDTGESVTADGMINFPDGGRNPNPPVFDWTTVLDAYVLDQAGVQDPVGLALNLATGVWGALTIFPIFVIGAALWDRRAGIWAAAFMAFSAPHIQRGVFGFADHDATTMFWIVLTMAFMVKAVQAVKQREYVSHWPRGAMEGIRKGVSDNQVAIWWSALAGAALAGAALTWKGYPYVLAFMAVALGFQLLADHMRNKDSTVLALVYLIPTVLSLLVISPYYGALSLGASTTTPHLYVLIGMLLATVILVPTRDLPSIVVFPATLGAAILGLLALLLLVPGVGNLIFSGLGYFNQSKLFSTIAEAQRTELGFVAASFGFFMFVVAFWPFVRTLRRAWKGDASHMLMASWAVVAMFMAFAASRFVMNASPVFVLFGGAAASMILSAAGFDAMARRRRQLHGQGNAVGNWFKSLSGRGVTFSLIVVVFLLLPNMWIGVDAGMSSDFERENDLSTHAFGAFGIGYDVRGGGWLQTFDALSQLDTDLPEDERPGFIAWWDYGHWATALGRHPTVADPFQNHYEIAGRFLAAESESEGARWLSVLLIDANVRHNGEMSPGVRGVLETYGVSPDQYGGGYDAKMAVLDGVGSEASFDFYHDLMDTTGQEIRYFGADSRMWPVSAFNSGIFYAPVYLANKNPDDFIQLRFQGDGVDLAMAQYGVDEDGNSYRLPEPTFTDRSGEPWSVVNNLAFPGENVPLSAANSGQGIPVQADLQLGERFGQTMYTRGFGHLSTAVPPAQGLTHWKAIQESTALSSGTEFRQTVLLTYFRGHTVEGQVIDSDGRAMPDVEITFVDDFGAFHDVQTTDASGNFEVLAPWGALTLTIRADGEEIHSEPYTIQLDQDGGRTDDVTVEVPLINLDGFLYRDLDGDNIFTDADQPLANANVTTNGMTFETASDGSYLVPRVPAGTYTLEAQAPGYESATATVTAQAGFTTTTNISLRASPAMVTVTFRDGGEGVQGIPIDFEGPDSRTETTGENGTTTVSLQAGTYDVIVDYSFTRDGVETVYDERRTLTVPFGGEPVSLVIDAS